MGYYFVAAPDNTGLVNLDRGWCAARGVQVSGGPTVVVEEYLWVSGWGELLGSGELLFRGRF
jgi:hypothetical protein